MVPFLKRTVAPKLINTGANILKDVVGGKKLSEAVVTRAGETLSEAFGGPSQKRQRPTRRRQPPRRAARRRRIVRQPGIVQRKRRDAF